MEKRLNYAKAAPQQYQALNVFSDAVEECGLEPLLLTLVQMRASQINGCAYCLDMHDKDAIAMGESETRLHGLNAWRETPYYTDRERAALLWTETVTLISETRAPDDVYQEVRSQFNEEDLAKLTMAIISINAWNRLCISFRSVPGNYVSTRKPLAEHA